MPLEKWRKYYIINSLEKNSNQRPKLGLRKSRVLNLPQKGAQKSKQNLHTQNNITEEDLKHAVIPPLK
jgi:hypothetical protein